MATTYDYTNGSILGQKKQHATTPRGFEPFMLRNIVRCPKQNLTNNSDIGKVLAIPAGVTVMACWINVITLDSGGGTVSLGVTAVDAAKWGSAIGMTPVGNVADITGGPDFNPMYFSSADTIDVLQATAAITTGVFEVIAWCVKSSDTVDAGE
jgi:hypothetical protein